MGLINSSAVVANTPLQTDVKAVTPAVDPTQPVGSSAPSAPVDPNAPVAPPVTPPTISDPVAPAADLTVGQPPAANNEADKAAVAAADAATQPTGLIGGNTVDNTTAPTATTREITSRETVAGQLNDLLGADSKYMQSARANGLAIANSRGLINSSMAAGAAQKAAIDAAAPIATSDANVYANANQATQNTNQAMTQAGYNAQLTSAINAENAGYQTDLADKNIQANKDLAGINNEASYKLQTDLKQMGLNIDLAKMNSDSRQSFMTAYGQASQQAMKEKSAIDQLTNAQMTPEAKAAAKANIEQDLKNFVNGYAALNGLELSWNPVGSMVVSNPAGNTGTGGTGNGGTGGSGNGNTGTGQTVITGQETLPNTMTTATPENIAKAYQTILGRSPSPEEVANWSGNYNGNTFYSDFTQAAQNEVQQILARNSAPTNRTGAALDAYNLSRLNAVAAAKADATTTAGQIQADIAAGKYSSIVNDGTDAGRSAFSPPPAPQGYQYAFDPNTQQNTKLVPIANYTYQPSTNWQVQNWMPGDAVPPGYVANQQGGLTPV